MGSGFQVYASELVMAAPKGVAQVGVILCPVQEQQLSYVNSAALSLLFNLFEESYQNSQLNSIHIKNKTDKLINVQRRKQIGNLFLWKL